MQEYIAKAKAALMEDGRTRLFDLRVWWNGSALVLEGHVTLYYHKQLVQHIVMAVGVVAIENRITVKRRTAVLV